MEVVMIDNTRVSAFHFSEFLESFERVSSEVERLVFLIQNQFIDYLNKSGDQFVRTEAGVSYHDIDNGYLTNTICISFELIKKPKTKCPIGYLTFTISLSGKGTNQYESTIHEPLIHVEFTSFSPDALDDTFHHPVKRERYFEFVDYCDTKICNNIIVMHEKDCLDDNYKVTELIAFVFSLRLFSINGQNLEEILFKPATEATLKYLLSDQSILDVTLDEYAVIDIPPVKSDSNEIQPYDLEHLKMVVDYISINKSFSFGEIQKSLRIGRPKLQRMLEILIGKKLITQISIEQFELLEDMGGQLKIYGLQHNFY